MLPQIPLSRARDRRCSPGPFNGRVPTARQQRNPEHHPPDTPAKPERQIRRRSDGPRRSGSSTIRASDCSSDLIPSAWCQERMGGHIQRRVTVLAPRPERCGRPAALEGVVGRLEAKVRLEEPRVLCPPPDQRLVIPVGQHRGHCMSGALAHCEAAEHSLGRESGQRRRPRHRPLPSRGLRDGRGGRHPHRESVGGRVDGIRCSPLAPGCEAPAQVARATPAPCARHAAASGQSRSGRPQRAGGRVPASCTTNRHGQPPPASWSRRRVRR